MRNEMINCCFAEDSRINISRPLYIKRLTIILLVFQRKALGMTLSTSNPTLKMEFTMKITHHDDSTVTMEPFTLTFNNKPQAPVIPDSFTPKLLSVSNTIRTQLISFKHQNEIILAAYNT